MKNLSVLSGVLLLAACGGGGTSSGSSSGSDSGSSTTHSGIAVGGIYTGIVGVGVVGGPDSGTALVDENGNAQFMNQNFALLLNPTGLFSPYTLIVPVTEIVTSDGTFSTAATQFSELTALPPSSNTLDITVTPRTSIVGTYGSPPTIGPLGNPAPEINVTYDAALYESTASFSLIAATYVANDKLGDHGSTATLTIDSKGRISGTDNAKCRYSGSFSIPDSKYNLYDVSISNSCDSEAVIGLAFYVAATTDHAAYIKFAGNDSSLGFVVILDPASD